MPQTRADTGPRLFEPEWLQRSLDRYLMWGLVFMVVLLVGFPLYFVRDPGLRAAAQRQQQTIYAHEGAALFAQNCAQCHGPHGVGDTAPTLNAKEFLNTTSDDQLHLLISGGVSGTSMPAWNLDFGGPLTDEQVSQLITYIRSLQPAAPSVPDWRQGKIKTAGG